MRYLIVGFGNIGKKRAAVLGKKVTATVDPDPKQDADYTDIHDVPSQIYDAAVLTIPQQFKFPLTEYFLSIGKHVLVEKPLIISTAQGKHLQLLAVKNGVIWYTSYNHRFEPNIIKIKKLLEKDTIGKLYHARFVYSFGNIKERIGTWRETEFGVLEEIVPHQIDFIFNFFGYGGDDFKTLIARKVESKIFDHWVIATKDNKVIVECGAVTWKNFFSIDIYGELGSIHLNGLRKWSGGELTVRKRVFPTGVPKERISFDSGPDITWKKDFAYFEKKVLKNKSTLENDLQMSKTIDKICQEAKLLWKNH